jgi:hypothetical protein
MRAVGALLIALLLVAPVLAEAQTTHEPPPVEVTESTMAVTIEAEEERDGAHDRFEYTLRYLSTTADSAPIVQLEIGVPGTREGRITERPIALEGPPGWTATAIPDRGSNPQTWRISWSCAHSGWDHRVKHQVRPGQVVRGFRAVVPQGASGYATTSYRVFVDPDRGVGAPRAVGGRVSKRRQ